MDDNIQTNKPYFWKAMIRILKKLVFVENSECTFEIKMSLGRPLKMALKNEWKKNKTAG